MNRLIILNPASKNGKAARNFAQMLPSLHERLGSGIQIQETNAAGDATLIVRQTLRDEETAIQQILVAGGDGTINEAVNGYFNEHGEIIRQDIPLGVINLGTGGDFFRTITELSENYETALNEARFSLVDYGEVSRSCDKEVKYFINISSLGLGGEMLNNLKKSSFQSGAAAYFFHTVKTLLAYRPNPVDIEYTDEDGNLQKIAIDLINLFICNGRCSGGGMKWAPSAELTNGLFEVTLISGKRKLPLIINSSKVYAGKIAELPGARQMQASEVIIRYRNSISLETDGEIIPAPQKRGDEKREICFRVRERAFPLVI